MDGGAVSTISAEDRALLTLCACDLCGFTNNRAYLEISHLRDLLRRIAAASAKAETAAR